MDSDEAKEQLRLIQQAQENEKQLGRPEVGWFLLIWGVVWLAGFLFSQFGPPRWLFVGWMSLMSAGSIFSAVVGISLGRQVQYTQSGPKLGWFYTACIGFAIGWIGLARPSSWQQTAVLAITILSFAILSSGILLKVRSLSVIGLISAAIAIIIYFLIPAQFGLLMALLGGGGMILTGLTLMRGHRG